MADTSRATAEWIASVERRLHSLATAPVAPNTSVQGGRTRWLNSAGEPVVVIGVDEASEDPHIRVYNDDASALTFDISAGVMRRPIAAATWQRPLSTDVDSNGRVITSSGSYAALAETCTYLCSPRISVVFGVWVNLGSGVTACDVKITALLLGIVEADGTLVTTGGGEQTVREWTGITATGQLIGGEGETYVVPDAIRSPAASPIGASVLLQAQARVTGGAGDIWIHPGPLLVSSVVA